MGLNPNGNILIWTPTLCLNPNPFEYQSSLLSVLNQIQRQKMGLSYYPMYRQHWNTALNQAFNIAFQAGFEYILRIDDDIHQIPDDAFEKLLKADKDVIGAAFPNRRFPFFTAAMNRTKDKPLVDIWMQDDMCLQYVMPKSDKPEDEIVEAELVGFGMMLIKTEPFKFLKRPLWVGYEDCPDDTYFAQLCMDNKIKQYVHFGVKVAHSFVTYQNNLFLYNAGVVERIQAMKKNAKDDSPLTQEDLDKMGGGFGLVSTVNDK